MGSKILDKAITLLREEEEAVNRELAPLLLRRDRIAKALKALDGNGGASEASSGPSRRRGRSESGMTIRDAIKQALQRGDSTGMGMTTNSIYSGVTEVYGMCNYNTVAKCLANEDIFEKVQRGIWRLA